MLLTPEQRRLKESCQQWLEEHPEVQAERFGDEAMRMDKEARLLAATVRRSHDYRPVLRLNPKALEAVEASMLAQGDMPQQEANTDE